MMKLFIDKMPRRYVELGKRYLAQLFILRHCGLTGSEFISDLDVLHYGRKGQKWGVRNGPPYPLRGEGLKAYDGTIARVANETTGIQKDKVLVEKPKKRKKQWDEYDIKGPKDTIESEEIFHLVEGTSIRNPKVFAGKDGAKPLKESVRNGLEEQYPGSKAEDWQHSKGYGDVDYHGEERSALIHWFQEEHVGKHKFRIKEWIDE